MSRFTPVFLVLLRLAIAWHFLVEGWEKIHTDNWTSAGYLREAVGPAAPLFHKLAGDPVLDQMELLPLAANEDPARTPARRRLPPALVQEWQNYFDRFVAHYGLDEQQRKEAEARFVQRQEQTASWLLQGKHLVKRTSPYGPPVDREMTTAERVQEYRDKLEKVRKIQTEEMVQFGSDVNPRLRAAKAEAAQLRAELLGDPAKTMRWSQGLDQIEKAAAEQKKLLESLGKQAKDLEGRIEKVTKDNPEEAAKLKQTLAGLRKREAEVSRERQALLDRQQVLAADLDLSKQTALMKRSLRAVLTPEQSQQEPLAEPIQPGWKQWGLLDWCNVLVKYGLFAVGASLLLGLFTRTACVGGAGYLVLFYLAMPALPWLPDNPRAEGHYLFINKNIIEMLALLALASTRSGRWLGLDGLVQFLNPRCWRTGAPQAPLVEPVPVPKVLPPDLGPATPRPDLQQAERERTEVLTEVSVPADNGAKTEAVAVPTSPAKETSDGP